MNSSQSNNYNLRSLVLKRRLSYQNSKGNCSKLKTQEFFLPPTPKKGKGYLLKHLVDVQNPYPCLQFSLPFQTQPKPYYRPDSSAFYRHTHFTPDIPKFNSKVHKPYPMSKQHGSKTIFFSATHTDTARIRGCTPLPRVSP